jgi:hypothetical protein
MVWAMVSLPIPKREFMYIVGAGADEHVIGSGCGIVLMCMV